MIYVDQLVYHRLGGRKLYCHMLSSNGSLEELHMFAQLIGRPRHWFHPSADHYRAHYDLDDTYRAKALANGAEEINTKDYLTKLSRIMREKNEAERGQETKA